MSTHREEKHEMLRNAVLHSALPNAPIDDERTVFLNLLDEFSVAHIQVLKAFDHLYALEGLWLSFEDAKWRLNGLALDSLFDFVGREIQGARPEYHLFISILSDLHNRELISNTHPRKGLAARMSDQPELTDFGRKFLEFIEFPLDD